jgi:hypothetical protein
VRQRQPAQALRVGVTASPLAGTGDFPDDFAEVPIALVEVKGDPKRQNRSIRNIRNTIKLPLHSFREDRFKGLPEPTTVEDVLERFSGTPTRVIPFPEDLRVSQQETTL